ncbi:hypothetical protein [Rhodopseudomonas sp. P2A-2r]|uniref:hypothetical protein n=1 Tax=Rhodopseudomonas sp. P2A-2r TaxID=2991972 RepID=UPI0029FEE2E7|nr:hypothetical protein [Rhodopseudomonas sp. P2A-2r]
MFLKGNHETFIRRFLDVPESLSDWRSLGGLETLVSYGLRPSLSQRSGDHKRLSQELLAALPPQHLSFFDSLPLSFTCGDFFFVHAGIRPEIALRKQTEDDLLWILRRLPASRLAVREIRRPWTYAGQRTRRPVKSGEHRYRSLRHGTFELRHDRRAGYRAASRYPRLDCRQQNASQGRASKA